MNRIFSFLALGFGLVLSACAVPATVTREAPMNATTGAIAPAGAAATVVQADPRDWRLAGLEVIVPETLVVSEANTIKPRADIVWREDPLGDRYAQVEDVMRAPLEATLTRMEGDTPVNVQLTMTRFHAVTERTRYAIRRGGEHEIEFDLVISNADTGEVLRGPEHVDLTFPAYGGQQAIEAERRGITQRVRIQSRIARWVSEEFGIDLPTAMITY